NSTSDAKTEATVGFIPGDNRRDTISLIFSRVATILLCIYTAIHLNIPPQRENKLRKIFRYVQLGIISLLTPELVLYTAITQ
ncbi:hypothetical protein CC80DRAFT_357831, partial [Byssothecium circinans]